MLLDQLKKNHSQKDTNTMLDATSTRHFTKPEVRSSATDRLAYPVH